ncbi:bifunctional diaminohydroxyphosphoribosylaminopyrimidine deaminase/5-amino-6-(5-phosphoribosylamino)uracil reductase RibD [Deferribacterales bacterium RsTz2092]|nr:riboflavin biosynthesis protein RibD [Deferribacterales bacterium]
MSSEIFMRKACELAKIGRGRTGGNPCVGAVIVNDGVIVGEGAHLQFGCAHAEVNALNVAGARANGAVLYVTLEPCSTYGKTPPCTDAIIKAGIKRVYIGALDPNPKHTGKAIAVLEAACVSVQTGVLEQECTELIRDFTKLITTGLPYVVAKAAQSIDGLLATASGDSKWISSEVSRRRVHQLRAEADAVLVGVGTALADDPLLTARLVEADRQPVRVVFDSSCRLPLTSKLVASARDKVAPLIVVVSECAPSERVRALRDNGVQIITSGTTQVDVELALRELGKIGIKNIILEGGRTLFNEFISKGFVDRMLIFIAPIYIGDAKYIKDSREFVFGGATLDATGGAGDIVLDILPAQR